MKRLLDDLRFLVLAAVSAFLIAVICGGWLMLVALVAEKGK